MSDYLNKVFTTATNRKIWTTSFWIKRTNLGNTSHVIGAGSTSARPTMEIFISSTGYFGLSQYNGSGYDITLNTNRLLRDCHAWYHIIVAVDTTQATASNRVKIYFNGIEETSFSTANYFSQNFEPAVNSATTHSIGRNPFGNGAGSMTDSVASFYFIDGQALTPTSFGETDATTGIWKPKSYSGSYGTNGFFLKFENSGSLGTDSSGNGNNFTVNGTPTQTLDTPSNVFATLNPLDVNGLTLTTGNLTGASVVALWKSGRGTLGMSKGKWYWEAKATASASSYDAMIGVGLFSLPIASYGEWSGANPSVVYSAGAGDKILNGSQTAYGSSYTVGDIIGVAFDADNLTVTFYKNGTSQGTITTGWSVNDYAVEVAFYGRDGGTTSAALNFGNGYFGSTAISSPYSDGAGLGKFQYQPPTGYYALCTKNINIYG